MKKLLLSLGSAGVLGLGSIAAAGTAAAASPSTAAQVNGAPSTYAASHTNRLQSRLDQAVASGQLTSDQRSAILAENDRLRAAVVGTSAADRRTAAHNMHSQLVAWAQQNGIPVQFVTGYGNHGHSK